MSVSDMQECRYAEDDDVLRQYARGVLSGDAAERFEGHLFGCDRCDGELRRAVELRAALTPLPISLVAPTEAPPPVVAFPMRRFRPLYLPAAAAMLLVMLGFWQLRGPGPADGAPWPGSGSVSPEPMRGSAALPIPASGNLSGDTFHASWMTPRSVDLAGKELPHSRVYLVQFFGQDGTPLSSVATGETFVTVPLSGPLHVAAFYWNVQMLDADGVAIGRSEMQRAEKPVAR